MFDTAHPALWAPDGIRAADRAWRTGWGDLPWAARGFPVPAMVQLGVTAHGTGQRLRSLSGQRSHSRIARVWGPEMIGLVRRITEDFPGQLLQRIQHDVICPLERELLNAGHVTDDRHQLVNRMEFELQPWRITAIGWAQRHSRGKSPATVVDHVLHPAIPFAHADSRCA